MEISIAQTLNDIFDGRTLSREDAREVIGHLMDGKLSQMQAAALLAALRMRGETVEEIVGFAEAMRARAVKVPIHTDEPLLDIVGTGGTGISTFNVSTATLFVVAAADVKIAKHGNRGVTRKSGAADVLEAMGVNLDQTPEQLAESLVEVGISFLYARAHHPAMKFVAPIRADIQARTVFNSIGPLTNPANADYQLMGVYDPHLTETLAKVLKGLGVKRGMVVHGSGLDELSVCGENKITEFSENEVKSYELEPEDVGLARYNLKDILGGTPEENARTIRRLFSGDVKGAKRDIVLLNAGAALYIVGKSESIAEGIKQAETLIDNGKALGKLERYIAFSQA
ncbi:MAG: anthranilate phosphoribosyltransferase [Trueperaceae bacterium]|nr:anthranilate phosphoribosyltransferase [Trueperaceae bacterium]